MVRGNTAPSNRASAYLQHLHEKKRSEENEISNPALRGGFGTRPLQKNSVPRPTNSRRMMIWPGDTARKPPLAPSTNVGGFSSTLTYVSSSSSSHSGDGDDESSSDLDEEGPYDTTFPGSGSILHDTQDTFDEPERSLVVREAELAAPDRLFVCQADDLADYCCGEETWMNHTANSSTNNSLTLPAMRVPPRQNQRQQPDVVDALCEDLFNTTTSGPSLLADDGGLDLLTRMINETSLRWKESVANIPHPSVLSSQRQEIEDLKEQLRIMEHAASSTEHPQPLMPSLENNREQPVEQIDDIPVDHIVLDAGMMMNTTGHADDLTVWSGWTQPHIHRPEPELARKSTPATATDLALTLQAANGRRRRAIYTGTVEMINGNRVVTGQGTLTFSSGDAYTGQVVRGEMHGRGAYQKRSGQVLAGRFEHNVFVG